MLEIVTSFMVYIGGDTTQVVAYAIQARNNVRAAMAAIHRHARHYPERIASMDVGAYCRLALRMVEDKCGSWEPCGTGTVISYSMVYGALKKARKLRQCQTCNRTSALSDADVRDGETTCGRCYKQAARAALRHKCEYCNGTGFIGKHTPVQCGACDSFTMHH